MKWKLFTWDWKAQAPVQWICEELAEMPGFGWQYIDTQSDEYAGVLCPKGTTPEQATAEYRKHYSGEESQIEDDE